MTRKRATERQDHKTCAIQSKVSAETGRRIDAIVKKYGFSARYELLQFLLSAFLRYADPEGETDPDESGMLDEIGKIFQGFESPETRINTVRPSDQEGLHLSEAILIYTRGRATACRKMEYGEGGTTSTCSVNAVLTTVLQRLFPAQYESLLQVASELHSESVLIALDYLIEADRKCGRYTPDGFAANEYGIVPVRHHNLTHD